MHTLITGGTGVIGRRLVEHLTQHSYEVTVISRRASKPATLPTNVNFARWDAKTAAGWGHLAEKADVIVNLAGAGLADSRWTAAYKKEIESSRINSGRAITEAIGAATNKPQLLIQMSAVGYYGSGDKAVTEENGPGNGFLADLCRAWESATEPVEEMGLRRLLLRSGVVLDNRGGALPKMAQPFYFMVGGPVGSGRQWMPWIHHQDVVEAIRFLIEHETVSGPVNLTSPKPLRNREFVKVMGRVLHRPALAPAPAFVLKLIFGEMASILLEGQQVVPNRLQTLGYQFKFPTLEAALSELLA